MTVFDEAIAVLDRDDYLTQLQEIWEQVGESHNRRKISQQSFHVNIAQPTNQPKEKPKNEINFKC